MVWQGVGLDAAMADVLGSGWDVLQALIWVLAALL